MRDFGFKPGNGTPQWSRSVKSGVTTLKPSAPARPVTPQWSRSVKSGVTPGRYPRRAGAAEPQWSRSVKSGVTRAVPPVFHAHPPAAMEPLG